MVSLRWSCWSIHRLLALMSRSLQALSQASIRVNGILIFLGGSLATGGYMVAWLSPSPLAATWIPSCWTLILGVLLLVTGLFGLYLQYILRPGILGRIAVMMLMLGTLTLVTGTATLDIFILPWILKLISQLSSLHGPMPRAISQALSGTNSVSSGIANTISTGCKNALELVGQHCSSAIAVPSIPSLQSQPSVNTLLSQVGLASLDSLKICGLAFLSGAPLALSCLLLSLTFLRAGLRSRMALFMIMFCACLNLGNALPMLGMLFPDFLDGLLLNLGSFFLSHLSFVVSFSGVFLFLSIAWLGFTLWFPWKLHRCLPWPDASSSFQRVGGWFKQQQ